MLRVSIARDEAAFDREAASVIVEVMKSRCTAVVGMSTGRTTNGIHKALVAQWEACPFEVDGLTVFNVDELTNVDRYYAGACYAMIKNEVMDPMRIPIENLIMPLTYSDDFEAEAARFEETLDRRGGIDLQVLGLGTNGHIGFNQPGTPFDSDAWVSEMDEELEARIRRETGTPDDVHLGGVTLGIRSIMHARRILLVAKGKSKAQIVKQMLEGPITTDVPASILQLHPDCTFLLDTEAAAELEGTYK